MADFVEESGRLWDLHARRDPLWAILADPARSGGNWDPGRFMQTGIGEVATLLYELQSHGIALARGSALDFGCGVGRLSQALAPHFDRVTGVDVSEVMIEKAQILNRFPQSVRYVCNRSSRLQQFPDGAFDFILSNIVLQHVRPDITKEYLREFSRLLAPGGALVFQLPSHRRRAEDAALPPGRGAMPDEAYHAAIVVLHVAGEAATPGAEVRLHLAVSNRSPIDWRLDAHGPISAGNHWSDTRGRMLVRDDGRTALPPVLRAGDTCQLGVVARVPIEPGHYYCELDLAHEGVTWFSDRGSPRTRVALEVGGATPRAAVTAEPEPISAPAASSAPPLAEPGAREPEEFPMFGVPSDEVVALIRESGITLRHVEDDRSCGPDWVSYRYVATRS